MCVTHGMPCVNMHDTLIAINRSAQIQFVQSANSVRGGSSKEEEEKGRKGEEKGEEERKRKEEEEGVLRSEQTRTAKNPELRYKR